MSKYTYDDIVTVRGSSVPAARVGTRAWVVSVLDERNRFPLAGFPRGIVYTVEFEDGVTLNVHEDDLGLSPEP